MMTLGTFASTFSLKCPRPVIVPVDWAVWNLSHNLNYNPVTFLTVLRVRNVGKAGLSSCHMKSLVWLDLNVSPGYGLESLAWTAIHDCSIMHLPSAPEQAGSAVAPIHPRQNSLVGSMSHCFLGEGLLLRLRVSNSKPHGLIWPILGCQRYCTLCFIHSKSLRYA